MGRLQDKVAVITGGGSGLGRAVVERYVSEGARVVVLESMPHKADALAVDLGDQGIVVCGDARDASAVEDVVSKANRELGGIDVLVGIQGIWDGNRHLVDLSLPEIDAAFDEIFSVNVKAYMLAARAALESLRASCGSIILTLSNAAFRPDGGGPLYVSSKHAGLGLVRQLAFELAPDVRVNGVAPGGIGGSDLRGPRTLGLDETSQAAIPHEDFEAEIRSITPLRFLPEASDYGAIYVFLASAAESKTMTGHVIEADQGMSIRGLHPID